MDVIAGLNKRTRSVKMAVDDVHPLVEIADFLTEAQTDLVQTGQQMILIVGRILAVDPVLVRQIHFHPVDFL